MDAPDSSFRVHGNRKESGGAAIPMAGRPLRPSHRLASLAAVQKHINDNRQARAQLRAAQHNTHELLSKPDSQSLCLRQAHPEAQELALALALPLSSIAESEREDAVRQGEEETSHRRPPEWWWDLALTGRESRGGTRSRGRSIKLIKGNDTGLGGDGDSDNRSDGGTQVYVSLAESKEEREKRRERLRDCGVVRWVAEMQRTERGWGVRERHRAKEMSEWLGDKRGRERGKRKREDEREGGMDNSDGRRENGEWAAVNGQVRNEWMALHGQVKKAAGVWERLVCDAEFPGELRGVEVVEAWRDEEESREREEEGRLLEGSAQPVDDEESGDEGGSERQDKQGWKGSRGEEGGRKGGQGREERKEKGTDRGGCQ